MEIVKGYVDHIIYRNEDNGYTVFQLNNEDGDLTCVGKFHFIEEGELLECEGEFIVHKVYGTQLKVESSKVCPPEDLISIERYLGSGAIKGLGAALAGRIVKKFKDKTFQIIEEEPERLAEIKGISMKKAREIGLQVEEKKDMRSAMIFLQKYGVSTTLAAKIYQHYGQSVYKVIEENPYQMSEHVPGVGFKTADEIAMKVGIQTNSDYRIRCGILYCLSMSVGEGHIYLEQDVLLNRASQLLGIPRDGMEMFLSDLAMDRKIVIQPPRVYSAHYYYMELNTARMLHELNVTFDISDVLIENKLRKIENETQVELDELQREAVKKAVNHGITIISGGPGTGKTTTINTMIQFFEAENMEIMLAAPTGRAAKRMTEATHYEAQTIHRLLEVNGNPEEGESSRFEKNAENPLETDVLIIDEMSMVDLNLIYACLSAIIPGTRVVFVGDAHQLPSVGPGAVLKDLIDSHMFSVVMLTKIFRQAVESDIVVNAHRINRGEHILLDNKSKDFFFLKRQDANMIISNCIQLVKEKMPKYVDASMNEIQILTPMRKGMLGVERLNKILQEYLNPPDGSKNEKEVGDRLFREGDKVMQIKNDYQLEWKIKSRYGIVIQEGLGIFNGDTGVVKKIDIYQETLIVEYDECRLVEYPFQLLDELELAYAITIHKAQGSEYPAVVIPLLSGPRMLFNRNLLYTAVTRAKKCVTLVGDEEVFQNMIDNTDEQARNTTLALRIQEAY